MKKMEFNRDVEQIKYLIAHYENSTLENKKIILEELDYYLHQFDNANDFIFLGGLEKIVFPGNVDIRLSDLSGNQMVETCLIAIWFINWMAIQLSAGH